MARKKKESGGGYNWMDTYGDLVTLLLCFFVLLFSMSTIEETKWQALVQSLSGQTPYTDADIIGPKDQTGELNPQTTGGTQEELPINMEQLLEYLQNYVAAPSGGNVEVERDVVTGAIKLTFGSNTLFKPNQYVMLDSAIPYLELVGKALKNVEDILINVEAAGYVADAKLNSKVINDWYLSSNRAAAVINFLVDGYDLRYDVLKVSGHGINDPVADNSTEEGRQQNRRVELTIEGNDAIRDVIREVDGVGAPGASAPPAPAPEATEGAETADGELTPLAAENATPADNAQPVEPTVEGEAPALTNEQIAETVEALNEQAQNVA